MLRNYSAWRIIFSFFLILSIINLIVFFFNELLVVKLHNGICIEYMNNTQNIDWKHQENFVKVKLLLRVPRIYLLEMNSPNACAFGWGFFGQYAMGFSPEIIKVSEKEIEGCRCLWISSISLQLDVGNKYWLFHFLQTMLQFALIE